MLENLHDDQLEQILAILTDVQRHMRLMQSELTRLDQAMVRYTSPTKRIAESDYPTIDASTHRLYWRGKTIQFKPGRSLLLMSHLLNHVGTYVPISELRSVVWPTQVVSRATIRWAIYKLRSILRVGGMPELANMIDGSHQLHYGLVLNPTVSDYQQKSNR